MEEEEKQHSENIVDSITFSILSSLLEDLKEGKGNTCYFNRPQSELPPTIVVNEENETLKSQINAFNAEILNFCDEENYWKNNNLSTTTTTSSSPYINHCLSFVENHLIDDHGICVLNNNYNIPLGEIKRLHDSLYMTKNWLVVLSDQLNIRFKNALDVYWPPSTVDLDDADIVLAEEKRKLLNYDRGLDYQQQQDKTKELLRVLSTALV